MAAGKHGKGHFGQATFCYGLRKDLDGPNCFGGGIVSNFLGGCEG